MQTRIPIIIAVLHFSFSCLAQNEAKLKEADSLFKAKQYTQSFGIYQTILGQQNYSSAMLLKMAFIQEGLNHTGLSLYYLNLYQKASDDRQAVAKMAELAEKYRLEGYQPTEVSSVYHFFEKNSLNITRALSAFIFLSFSLLVFQKRKGKSLKVAFTTLAFFCSCLLITTNLTSSPEVAIVSSNKTYLMGGPSAGAPVVAVIEEGHRLTIFEKKDVWLRVRWRDKDAYVKESNVLPITI